MKHHAIFTQQRYLSRNLRLHFSRLGFFSTSTSNTPTTTTGSSPSISKHSSEPLASPVQDFAASPGAAKVAPVREMQAAQETVLVKDMAVCSKEEQHLLDDKHTQFGMATVQHSKEPRGGGIEFDRWNRPRTSKLHIHVAYMNRCLCAEDWAGLQNAWNMLESQKVKMNEKIYDSMSKMYIKTEDWIQLRTLLMRMEREGLDRTPQGFSILLHSYRKLKNWKRVLELSYTMEANRTHHCTYNFNEMLIAYLRMRNWARFNKTTETMEREGIKQDNDTLIILLDFYAHTKKWGHLEQLWHKILVEKIPRTAYIHSIMLKSCYEMENWRLFDDVWKLITATTKPDTHHYFCKMLYYQKTRKWAHLDGLWSSLLESTPPHETYLYNLMLNSYRARGKHTLLRETLSLMKKNDIKWNAHTYFAVMSHCAMEKTNRKELFKIWRQSKAEGIQRNASLYNIMLLACWKDRKLDKFDDLFKNMLEDRIAPDAFTCQLIIQRDSATFSERRKMFDDLTSSAVGENNQQS